MLAGRKDRRTERPVRTQDIDWRAIHFRFPTVGVVDFAEDGEAVGRGLVAVAQLVRGVGGQDDGICGIGRSSRYRRHVLADDGLMPQVDSAQERDFLISALSTGVTGMPASMSPRVSAFRRTP